MAMADGMAGGGSANVVPHTLHTRSWPVPAFIDARCHLMRHDLWTQRLEPWQEQGAMSGSSADASKQKRHVAPSSISSAVASRISTGAGLGGTEACALFDEVARRRPQPCSKSARNSMRCSERGC